MKTYTFILLCALFYGIAKAEIPEIERNALLSIKASANVNNNWSNEIPVEDWTGVGISEINGEDHVTGLNLLVSRNGDNYIIELDSEVSNLNYLNSLSMRVNEIGSNYNIGISIDLQNIIGLDHLTKLEISLPHYNINNIYEVNNLNAIGQLTQLLELKLGYNDENLSLPINISNLTNLKKLSYRNEYDMFPSQICVLTWLEELELDVDFNVWENTFENLPNMIHLKKVTIGKYSLFNTYFIPSEFYELPSLEWFSIYADTWLEISSDIMNYSDQLKYLYLDGQFVYFDNSFYSLESLETLYINSQNSYMVDPLISNLPNLKTLGVISGQTIQVPTTIKDMNTLDYLLLHPGQSSVFIDETYEIPNLKTFVAKYYDGVPENIGFLTSLEHLQIETYGELASLPESIGNLSNLKKLDLLGNSNSYFTFPETYFNWPLMEQFWTWYNVDYDFTNKFNNMPNLDILGLDISNKEFQNARGTLNLCNNQNLRVLTLYNSNITEVDFRNNQRLANNSFGYSTLTNNNIEKILVDDVTTFYNLVDQNRIRITENPSYEVLTSNEPCMRTMQTTDLVSKNPNFYPNPAKDYLTFVNQERVENVEIYSVDGKKYEVDYFSNKIDVKNLPTGVYMIKWTSNGMYKIDKFIKK